MMDVYFSLSLVLYLYIYTEINSVFLPNITVSYAKPVDTE